MALFHILIKHIVFAQVIVGISLGTGCVIEFVNSKTKQIKELYVKPRSLYVLSGKIISFIRFLLFHLEDARYIWTHSIHGKEHDVVNGKIIKRGRRILVVKCFLFLIFKKVIGWGRYQTRRFCDGRSKDC